MSTYCNKLTAIGACVFIAAMAHASEPGDIVVDVHGSQQITGVQLQQQFAGDFAKIAQAMQHVPANSNEKFASNTFPVGLELVKKIKPLGDFDQISLSYQKFNQDPHTYFMVDIVERKDADKTHGFAVQPRHSYADPDNLLKTWHEYAALGQRDFLQGQTVELTKNCPAFHCVWGFEKPDYQKFQTLFDQLVPVNTEKLATILHDDKDARKRSAAAFLLAHNKDLPKLINLLIPALTDPASQVRADVMAILSTALPGTVSTIHFPLDKVIGALQSPYAADRSGALAVLATLADQPRYAQYIKEHASHALVTELTMQQPVTHQKAYQILRQISGQNYADRDYQAWFNWLTAALPT